MRTIHLTENQNNFTWSIPKGRGTAFEDLIHSYLKNFVATKDGRVKVIRTRVTGDEGRDFEVYFSEEINIFGIRIKQPINGSGNVVYIECKSTEHERLDDEFIVDASQHKDFEASSYILVTNAFLTPYCQYRAQKEWQRRNSLFHLVDRRRLYEVMRACELDSKANELGLRFPEPSIVPEINKRSLGISCQSELDVVSGKQFVQAYLAVNNYSTESQLLRVGVATDLRWTANQTSIERVIEAGGVETIELTVNRNEFDSSADLDLNLTVNGRSHRITVSRINREIIFEPDFTGEEHRRIAQSIRTSVEGNSGFLLISFQGEAGVGKTRTIKEALKPLVNGQYEIFTYHFTRNLEDISFDDLFAAFGVGYSSDSPEIGGLYNSIDNIAKIDHPILLHFEDLHHASKDVIDDFKKLLLNSPVCKNSLVLIVTGRDDHTFPNEDYFSFLQIANDRNLKNACYSLYPFTDDDARTLIRSVVVDIPDPGVERVHLLGQNNPFIIVEILQYLLDSSLAQLLSLRTVGILNPEVFSGRKGLPETVEELYSQRLTSLLNSPNGDLAYKFLIVSSFFGFVMDREIRRRFFDGKEEGEDVWNLLCERRFIAEDTTNNIATFAHENLLNYLRQIIREPANSLELSSYLLANPGIAKSLSIFDLGEAYYLHEEFDNAFNCLTEIWERVREITNFSSEEINKLYFSYLPALFQTTKFTGLPHNEIAKIPLAYSYMGVHNFPLVVAEDVCTRASQMLDEIYEKETDGLRQKLTVRQLRAHALQNMGKTGLALQEMLEIEATLEENPADWYELKFDLYDRLQEYYRKTNHAALVRFYGRQARLNVNLAEEKDKKLLAAHLITQSVSCLFSGKKNACKQAAEAYSMSKEVQIQRFIIFNRLTELIIEGLYSHRDPIVIKAVMDEARDMLQDAAVKNFSDSIMRLQLLLATLALNYYEDTSERHSIARYYIESGQANSIRFGNGLFDWAFDNLAAVIDLADEYQPDDHARRRFQSCLERLKRRGLTFLGARDGLYPNSFAISNIIRFFSQFYDSDGLEILQTTFSSYNNDFLEDRQVGLELVRKAGKGQPIFWPRNSKFQMPRYPAEGGYFTPIF
ncbi:MAG TPA: hypothetical protein VGO50_02460 [Pyrinomonadaceae bacterium]|jgi:hypothetical protein|nr:hypothetical protein [Pyrinomonadaceae bacterium]